MMRLAFALAVALTATTVAAPIPKAEPAAAKVPNYFPYELYTKWEYECGEDVTVVEVTKVRHEKDCKIATFTHTRPSTGAKCDLKYRITKDEVWSFETDKKREYEMLQLKPSAKLGDAWFVNQPGFFTDGAKTVVRQPTTVEVPAGKFDVIGTSWTLKGPPAALFQVTNFYADGIGRVMTPSINPVSHPQVLK